MERQQELPIRRREAAGEGPLAMPSRVTRAAEMLAAFCSVGTEVFRLTCTDIDGRKWAYRQYDPSTLREKLPVIFETAEARSWNIIVRPIVGPSVTLIQLDDLNREALRRVEGLTFLELETSPGNYQAWVSVTDADETTARRLRMGTGSDLTASGATRVVGSLNIKSKYAEAFPTVELFASAPGATCTRADLTERQLLSALPEEAPRAPRPHAPTARKRRQNIFPSYELCLQDAPPARNHEGPDRSAADFEFALIAADRKFSVSDIAAKLLEVSDKAAAEGRRYAEFTAQRAADIVQKRRGSSPR